MKRLLSIALIVCIGLSGCGFALRSSLFEGQVSITSDDSEPAIALKTLLLKKLTPSAVNYISLKDVHFRRYELLGTSTEVRLLLIATVQYADQPQRHTLQVERSYQYNKATLSPNDEQENRIKTALYQSLAQRIADQHRLIAP